MPSKIEWTSETWNPVVGCTKISDGCKNCYAERMAMRLAKIPATAAKYRDVVDANGWTGKVHLDHEALKKPLRWRKPRMVFVNSMGDLFHPAVPLEFIAEVFDVMACATLECNKRHKHVSECWTGDPHTFQVLTKYPDRARQVLTDELPHLVGQNWSGDTALSIALQMDWPLSNVWLGTSIANQATADKRISDLLYCPAAVRFVSIEPMLEMLYFGYRALGIECPECHGEEIITDPKHYLHPSNTGDFPEDNWCTECSNEPARVVDGIDWGIIGCESGPGRRSIELQSIRDVINQFQDSGVPVFVKQIEINGKISHDMNEWPEGLRVREYPKGTVKHAI